MSSSTSTVGRERDVSSAIERPRDGQVVARAEEHLRLPGKAGDERVDERCLPDAGLTADDDDRAVAALRGRVAVGERGEGALTLEQLHGRHLKDGWRHRRI
jgi:hypothetical protein